MHARTDLAIARRAVTLLTYLELLARPSELYEQSGEKIRRHLIEVFCDTLPVEADDSLPIDGTQGATSLTCVVPQRRCTKSGVRLRGRSTKQNESSPAFRRGCFRLELQSDHLPISFEAEFYVRRPWLREQDLSPPHGRHTAARCDGTGGVGRASRARRATALASQRRRGCALAQNSSAPARRSVPQCERVQKRPGQMTEPFFVCCGDRICPHRAAGRSSGSPGLRGVGPPARRSVPHSARKQKGPVK
jgi:hypothetical protein